MATIDISNVLARLTTYAEKTGIFSAVIVGNSPSSLPVSGLVCAISGVSLTPSAQFSGLNTTSALLTCVMRIFKNKNADPIDLVDVDVFQAAVSLYEQLHTGITLSGDAIVTDILQIERDTMTAISGFVPGDNGFYQVMDLTIPIILGDVWAQNG